MVHAKRKGSQYERDVVHWLVAEGVTAGRVGSAAASQGSHHQTYDLWADLPLTIECKNQKAMKLASWVDQSVEQAEAGAEGDFQWLPGVVIHKRAGKGDVGEHYATMRVKDLLCLMRLIPEGSIPDQPS